MPSRIWRSVHPRLRIRFESRLGIGRISFIVNRPKEEPGFRLDRQEVAGRNVRYSTHAYAATRPEDERYGGP